MVINDESIQLEVKKIKQKEEAASSFMTEINQNSNNDYFKMRNSTSVLPPVTFNQDLKESILEKKYKAVPNNKLR